MVEYIDRAKLMDDLRQLPEDCAQMVMQTILDQPVKNLTPVVYGTWVEGSFAWDETCGICGYHEFTCSECGFDTTDKYGLSRYCPDCGARMKRGKQPRNE